MARDRRRTAPPVSDVEAVKNEAGAVGTEEAEAEFGDGEESAEIDPRDEELARLRAENAELKAAREPRFKGGKKYRVKLKDGPTAVVQVGDGEHPWDAYCRATGVINSTNAAEFSEEPDEVTTGVCDHTGKVIRSGVALAVST